MSLRLTAETYYRGYGLLQRAAASPAATAEPREAHSVKSHGGGRSRFRKLLCVEV